MNVTGRHERLVKVAGLPTLTATETYATVRKVVGKISWQLTVVKGNYYTNLINTLLCIITYAKAGGLV